MEIRNKTIGWHITNAVWTVLAFCLPTKLFLSLKYYLIFRRWVNWENPQTFTEKLQWLKVNWAGKEHVRYVDKLLVKDYVAEVIGKEHVIPTIRAWNNAEDIEFKNLPDKFVMKCNHDSGSIVICNDKQSLDFKDVIRKFKKVLSSDYYRMGRELPYKFVQRKVFAEKLIQNRNGKEFRDFKFFCFNGEPKVFKIDFGRFVDHHANYYDIHKKLLPFGEIWPPPVPGEDLEFPENFDEMVDIAKTLAQGFPFVRVDLYNNDGNVLFGEMTFFPTSGFGGFTDEKWDYELGSWIKLP